MAFSVDYKFCPL